MTETTVETSSKPQIQQPIEPARPSDTEYILAEEDLPLGLFTDKLCMGAGVRPSSETIQESSNLIVVTVASDVDFTRYEFAYQDIYDMWSDTEATKQPIIIFNCQGFHLPLRFKHNFQGFLFASDTGEVTEISGLA